MSERRTFAGATEHSAADTTDAPYVQELIPAPDPMGCAESLGGLPFFLFLDSAARGRLGRYSFLTADPVAVVRSVGSRTECQSSRCLDIPGMADVDPVSGTWYVVPGTAFDVVRSLLGPYRTEPVPGLPPFQGGAAGYLGYEWGRVLEPGLPQTRYDDLALPDVILGLYDWVLVWDHGPEDPDPTMPGAAPAELERGEQPACSERPERAWLVSTGLLERQPELRRRSARERAHGVLGWLRESAPQPSWNPASASMRPGIHRAPAFPVEGGWWAPSLELRSSFTYPGYLEAIRRVREYILAGDIFQANLSQRFEAPLTEPRWSLYRRLRERNAAPFAAFLEYDDFALLSASPERFVSVDPSGRIQTRPIKGTRPRGVGPEHDAALGLALIESVKDRAENLMIVDLMRNDLSRVSRPGTVRVEELFTLERYASVHHLVSTVVGELAGGLDAGDLMKAAFPAGSITGAPKIRAMEIISELEPSARGAYCGSIGYWSVTGALDMNVAIRTAVALSDRLYFNAGGGIVMDSDPHQEYRETLDKAQGIIDALLP